MMMVRVIILRHHARAWGGIVPLKAARRYIYTAHSTLPNHTTTTITIIIIIIIVVPYAPFHPH
jgi:hypothetical protein